MHIDHIIRYVKQGFTTKIDINHFDSVSEVVNVYLSHLMWVEVEIQVSSSV